MRVVCYMYIFRFYKVYEIPILLPKIIKSFQNLTRRKNLQETTDEGPSQVRHVDGDSDPDFESPNAMHKKVNQMLAGVGGSPADLKDRFSERDTVAKRKIDQARMNSTKMISKYYNVPVRACCDGARVINEINRQFNMETTTNIQKIQLLTLFPAEVSNEEIRRLVQNASRRQVETARELQSKGTLSEPAKRLGKRLPEQVVQSVVDFYNQNEVRKYLNLHPLMLPYSSRYTSHLISAANSVDKISACTCFDTILV
jgi:hypothetical protein